MQAEADREDEATPAPWAPWAWAAGLTLAA